MEFLLIKKRFCDIFFCFRLIFGVIYFLFLLLPVNATNVQIAYTLAIPTEEGELSTFLSEATVHDMTAGAYEESSSYENKVALVKYYLLPDIFSPNALLTFQIKVDGTIVEFSKPDEGASYTEYSSSWMKPDLENMVTGSSIFSGTNGPVGAYRTVPKAIQIFMPSACGEHYFYAKATVSVNYNNSYKYFCLKFHVNLTAANTGSDSTVTALQNRVSTLETAVGTLPNGDPSLVTSVGTLKTNLTALKTAVGTLPNGAPSLATSVGKFSAYFLADEDDRIFFSSKEENLENLTSVDNHYTVQDAGKTVTLVPFIFQALNANDAVKSLNLAALKSYLVNPNSTTSFTEVSTPISEIMETIKTKNSAISDKQYRTCFRILQRISWLQSLGLHLKTKSTTAEMIEEPTASDIKTISDILGDILCFTPGVGFGANTPYNALVLDALQVGQTTPSSSVSDALKRHVTAWISDGANWTALEADAKAGIKTALDPVSTTGS